MIALLLLVSVLALIQAQPNCVNYPDDFNQYEVNLCPLNTSTITPPVIERPSYWVPTSVDTSVSTQFTLAFPVYLYGVAHTQFYMNTNGGLFFGSSGSSSGTLKMPVTYSYLDYLPIVAPLWTDLYYTAGTATAVYGDSGPVGSRIAVIRYANWHPYTTRTSAPEIQMSFDVIFYENRPGEIEFRYYRIDQTSATWRLSVGLQSWDWGSESMVVLTDTNDWASIQPLLHTKMLSFRFVGRTRDQEQCTGLGYNLEPIRGMQLNYTNSMGTFFFSPCSTVEDSRCRNSPTTDKAMICQVATSGTLTDWGVFGPGSMDWQYPLDSATGVEAVVQTGSYCSGILGDRIAVVNFFCDSTATTPFISEVGNVGTSVCVLRMVVRTSLACGGGSRGNDTELIYPASTLPRCNRVPGEGYTASLCPRNAEQRVPPAIVGGQTQVLQAVSTGSVPANLPFNFWFYGNEYSSLWISLNGGLYFGGQSTLIPTAPPNFGQTIPTAFPAIIAYGVGMSNLLYVGLNEPTISYSNQAQIIDGKQAFIVRYERMKYTSYRGLYDMYMTFDIILFAGSPGEIEIRYYKVSPNPLLSVSIGLHGPDVMDSYVAYVPYEPITATLSSQLQGATLSFNYTGRTSVDACAAFGVNFAGSFTDNIVYNDDASGLQYLLNPCGPLVGITPCRNGTSVCQVSGTIGTVLSTFNPSGVVWSRSPSGILGVRSTLRDGGWCSSVSQPRTVTIDWVCSNTVSQSTFVQMREVSTCFFSATIYTPIACQATVVCSDLSSKYYNGLHCPQVAPKLALTGTLPVFTSLTHTSARIPLNYPTDMAFHFYGLQYRYAFVTTNGAIGFGQSATLPPQLLPFSAPFMLLTQNSISYTNQTVDGVPAVIIRFTDVEFVGSNGAGNTDAITFDVILFAGVEGRVEIRYYAMNRPTNQVRVTVGTINVDNDPEERLTLVNNRLIDAAITASFSNSTIRISYSGPDITTAPCVRNGYNLTTLKLGNDLIYDDTDNRVAYAVHVCGPVSESNCVGQTQSAVCARDYRGIIPTYTSYSEYNPAEAVWLYPSNSNTGLQIVTQSGAICPTSTSTFYVTVMNLICANGATTHTVTSARLTGCTLTVNVTTPLVCGPGDRNVPQPPPQSTLRSCLSISGSLYDGRLCPRAIDDPLNTPEPLDNATPILAGQDDAAHIINLGFDFYLYDRIENSVVVNSNGLLTFGFVPNNNASEPDVFPNIGLSPDNFPVIAPLFTNLINRDTTDGVIPYTGSISYAFSGLAPFRRVIIRFNKVDYYSTRNHIAEESATFDVILTEGEPGGIEIRYYRIDAAAGQNVVVGMVGYQGNNSFTSVHNYVPISGSIAGQLQGTTLSFRFTGVNQPDFCVGIPGSLNLSLFANEFSYRDSSFQYFLSPCGVVRNPICTSQFATQRVSVCRASLDGLQTSALAGDSPASTTFSSARGSILASLADGATCRAGVPYRTIIEMQCDETALTPRITGVDTRTACVHTFFVQTSVVCMVNVFQGTQPELGTYDARLFYDPTAYKMRMTNPTYILNTSSTWDSGKLYVETPFPIYMYGEAFPGMYINVNGWIAFRSGSGTTSATSFPLSSTFTTIMPMILAGSADLHNSCKGNCTGISYSVEGIAPNRIWIVRYDGVNYYATRAASTNDDHLLSYDLKWYENSTTIIDVQYWQMTSWTVNMAIGIQSVAAGPMTVIQSAQQIAARGLFMEEQILRYTYNREPIRPSSSSTGLPAVSSSAASSSSSTAPPTSSPRSSSTSSPFVSSSNSVRSSSSSSAPSSSVVSSSSAARASSSSSSTAAAASSSMRSSSSSSVMSSSVQATSSLSQPTSSPSQATSSPSQATSSSAIVTSSPGPLPAGTVTVRFNVELPVNQDAEHFRAPMLNEIVNKLAAAHSVSAQSLANYLSLTISSVNGRRLLQDRRTMSATLTVRGDVSSAMNIDASSIANTAARQIGEGTLVTDVAGVRVPPQQPVVEGGNPSDSSSSSSLSNGAIAGIVIGTVAGAILLAAIAWFLCASSSSGKARGSRLEDEPSRVTQDHNTESHADEEMEMQTV